MISRFRWVGSQRQTVPWQRNLSDDELPVQARAAAAAAAAAAATAGRVSLDLSALALTLPFPPSPLPPPVLSPSSLGPDHFTFDARSSSARRSVAALLVDFGHWSSSLPLTRRRCAAAAPAACRYACNVLT